MKKLLPTLLFSMFIIFITTRPVVGQRSIAGESSFNFKIKEAQPIYKTAILKDNNIDKTSRKQASTAEEDPYGVEKEWQDQDQVDDYGDNKVRDKEEKDNYKDSYDDENEEATKSKAISRIREEIKDNEQPNFEEVISEEEREKEEEEDEQREQFEANNRDEDSNNEEETIQNNEEENEFVEQSSEASKTIDNTDRAIGSKPLR
jgi:hypothetical protein